MCVCVCARMRARACVCVFGNATRSPVVKMLLRVSSLSTSKNPSVGLDSYSWSRLSNFRDSDTV